MASVPRLRLVGWLEEAIEERSGILEQASDLEIAD